jgi:hypothetical protein
MVLTKVLDGVRVAKLFMTNFGAMAQTQEIHVHEIR